MSCVEEEVNVTEYDEKYCDGVENSQLARWGLPQLD